MPLKKINIFKKKYFNPPFRLSGFEIWKLLPIYLSGNVACENVKQTNGALLQMAKQVRANATIHSDDE